MGDLFGDINPIYFQLALFFGAGVVMVVFRGFFLAKKIQPQGFKLKQLRHEVFFAVVNIAATGFLMGFLTAALDRWEVIQFHQGPVSGWVIALEWILFFFAFDAYFYWGHRLMHIEPIYTVVHKVHHLSLSPNPLTTICVTPFESVINGGFVLLFTAVVTVHEPSVAFFGPTQILMGLYVHSGFEFFPRWWNKSWLTKWFITATFHDQHHRYFKGNYGGFTTLWDRLCGTMRPKFESDFEAVTTRRSKSRAAATVPAE